VQTGVHHQSRRPHRVHVEHAQPGHRVGVQAHLVGEQLIGVLPAQRRIGAQTGEDLAKVAGPERRGTDHGVLLGQPGDDLHAGSVQVLRRAVGGGVQPHQPGIGGLAAGQPAQAGAVSGPAVR